MPETEVYSKDDFLSGTAPFEEVYKHKGNGLEHIQAIARMADLASAVGVRNFRALYAQYDKLSGGDRVIANTTNFEGQPLELDSGRWYAEDEGVYSIDKYGSVLNACPHPIMPVRRLVNVDTGTEKTMIAYKRGMNGAGTWRYEIFDKTTLSTASKIVALADYGIAVTSETAKHLVTYISDTEYLNYDIIPKSNSVTRLGWIPEFGFVPYVDDLVFDGDMSFRHIYDSVTPKGKLDKWIAIASEAREKSIYGRIILAASFASVLIEPCNGLPFICHLWGTTGGGKTVLAMLAGSVWANPNFGKYTVTFNSTAVGHEFYASFLNSLPLVLDELQIIKDKKDFDQIIYTLSEGTGRTRGAKSGGLRMATRWRNAIITTGEHPLVGSVSGGGAYNRIIDLCCDEMTLFEDPREAAKICQGNYGMAGKRFIEHISQDVEIERIKALVDQMSQQLISNKKTGKQALAMAHIMVADHIISDLFFDGKDKLEISDVEKLLLSIEDVSDGNRAFEWLEGWIAENEFRFNEKFQMGIWGVFDYDTEYNKSAFIIKPIFDRYVTEAGFNPKSFLRWLGKNNKLGVTSLTRENQIQRRIKRNPTWCVPILLDPEFEMNDDAKGDKNDEDVPF